MNNSKPMNRRRFVKISTSVVAGIPLLATKIGMTQELPPLTEDDPTGQALAYKVDAASVDTAAYPNFADGQSCSTCALYTGVEGEASGPCGIFPGKSVTAAGWCSVYAPLPS